MGARPTTTTCWGRAPAAAGCGGEHRPRLRRRGRRGARGRFCAAARGRRLLREHRRARRSTGRRVDLTRRRARLPQPGRPRGRPELPVERRARPSQDRVRREVALGALAQLVDPLVDLGGVGDAGAANHYLLRLLCSFGGLPQLAQRRVRRARGVLGRAQRGLAARDDLARVGGGARLSRLLLRRELARRSWK